METKGGLLVDLLCRELGAAAQSAHDVGTCLKVVQKIMLDLPHTIPAEDVSALYAAARAAEEVERSLIALRDRLSDDLDGTS